MKSGNSSDRMTDCTRMLNRKVILRYGTLYVFELLTVDTERPESLDYLVQLRYRCSSCACSAVVPNRRSELHRIQRILSLTVQNLLPAPCVASVMSELAMADFGQPSTSIRSKPDERFV